MTTHIIYLAHHDNSAFNTPEACLEYETQCAQAIAACGALPEIPTRHDFANGECYIQHDPATLATARAALLGIIQQIFPQKDITGFTNHQIAYLLSESSPQRPTLIRLWDRIYHTGLEHREWGQPYYRNYPNPAAFCANPA